MSDLKEALDRALGGGPERHHEKAREQGKLPVRERVARLLDEGSFVEEALLANWERRRAGRRRRRHRARADRRPPGRGDGQRLDGQGGLVGAQDGREDHPHPGAALSLRVPLFYLVDSAGARITDQIEMFPGRRGAGRIFHNQVKLSRRRAAGLPAVRAVGARAARTSRRSATS